MEHNELEEMREQMALLNQKLDKEEIVSDETISEVTRKKMNRVQSNALIASLAILLVIPLIAWDCYKTIGSIFWIIWGLSAFCGNIILFWGLRNFKKKCNSLAESIETIQKIQKQRRITDIITKACFWAFLLSFVLGIVFKSIKAVKGINEPETIVNVMASIAFTIIVLAFVGSIVYVFHEIGKNDEPKNVLDQILEELQEPNITETDGNETVADTETGK